MPDKKLLDILNLSEDYLKKNNIDDPRLNAELLVSGALGMKRLDLYLQYDRIITEDELATIRPLLKRSSNNEPVQYIQGEKEFYNVKIMVNEHTLIPRNDTEILVEEVIKFISTQNFRILDIGTGSGCIPIAIAKECPNNIFFASDISSEVLDTARKNAGINDISGKIKFYKWDLFKSCPSRSLHDIVISNPPYISLKAYENLDKNVKDHEPRIALTDEGDGLTFYRRINDIIEKILKPNGMLFLEIGYDQAEEIKNICREKFEDINIVKDYGGNNRVFVGRLKQNQK
ncbi:MAG: peptide chain release factor N(5)-glutamine methyltransferase [Candidatus Delongbacteria bacterium]|jgi:release factor glutamine methyltransferase|nr:peptide chain release factor N(5)-glutamine methyltransferase [Candidatus Delongbacteria bacterium]